MAGAIILSVASMAPNIARPMIVHGILCAVRRAMTGIMFLSVALAARSALAAWQTDDSALLGVGLVELHGGSVRLASDLDSGTTVTCRFPRHPEGRDGSED